LPAVSDSSPLIWLSKVGYLHLLKSLYGEVIIPLEVYREVVVRGLEDGFSDALVIEESVKQGWVKISELDEKNKDICTMIMESDPGIHRGEVEAVLLARDMECLLLMDESSGRTLAESWSVKVRGTLYVILSSLRLGLLGEAEAKDAIGGMIEKGFRIDPVLYSRILREIESYSKP
jgi:predicted nucleic acid-binding protein